MGRGTSVPLSRTKNMCLHRLWTSQVDNVLLQTQTSVYAQWYQPAHLLRLCRNTRAVFGACNWRLKPSSWCLACLLLGGACAPTTRWGQQANFSGESGQFWLQGALGGHVWPNMVCFVNHTPACCMPCWHTHAQYHQSPAFLRFMSREISLIAWAYAVQGVNYPKFTEALGKRAVQPQVMREFYRKTLLRAIGAFALLELDPEVCPCSSCRGVRAPGRGNGVQGTDDEFGLESNNSESVTRFPSKTRHPPGVLRLSAPTMADTVMPTDLLCHSHRTPNIRIVPGEVDKTGEAPRRGGEVRKKGSNYSVSTARASGAQEGLGVGGSKAGGATTTGGGGVAGDGGRRLNPFGAVSRRPQDYG